MTTRAGVSASSPVAVGVSIMHVCYETVISPCIAGGYEVSCPDLVPGVVWPTEDASQAVGRGAWVVGYYVRSRIAANVPLPTPLFGHETPEGGFLTSVSVDLECEEGSIPGYCSVVSAAEMLHISTSRVRALARAGRLESRKHGGTWYISLESVSDRVEHPRRPGRPPKHASD